LLNITAASAVNCVSQDFIQIFLAQIVLLVLRVWKDTRRADDWWAEREEEEVNTQTPLTPSSSAIYHHVYGQQEEDSSLMVKSSSPLVAGVCELEKLLLQQFVVALNAETTRATCKKPPAP